MVEAPEKTQRKERREIPSKEFLAAVIAGLKDGFEIDLTQEEKQEIVKQVARELNPILQNIHARLDALESGKPAKPKKQ